ncbi:MAG TPA: hypothetical protein RMH26_01545, partial [Polyangiaceae bacterium LLY-WYZ-15_(1-7)]|nr:hypothetical protein [Polyangiaceae bacterium LLY-WYZ-15_(1-7)]
APAATAIAGLAAVFALTAPGTATAQERLEANDFVIDALATPVLASGRITGLGGAYTALAEGIDGAGWNPAAYAARALWELDQWEWELTGSVVFPGSFTEQDFFLNGQDEGFGIDDIFFLGVGGRLQFGDIGFGAQIESQFYTLTPEAELPATARFANIRVGGGYALLDGQVTVGLGARAVNMAISAGGEDLVNFTGVGAEVGGLLRLADQPFRVGASLRTPVSSTVVEDPMGGGVPSEVQGFVLPREVYLPWEVQAGFAFQIGPRPLNRRFVRKKDVEAGLERTMQRRRCERERAQVLRELEAAGEPAPELSCPGLRRRARDPAWRRAERERMRVEQEALDEAVERAEADVDALWEELYEALPRRYFLVSVDAILQGPTEDGVGIDAFLAQERRTRGDGWSFGFRLGVEGEPWPDRMKLRAGTYVEPARYEGVRPRTHGTFGVDFRVIEIFGIDIRASFLVDGARDYFSWGVGVGSWH